MYTKEDLERITGNHVRNNESFYLFFISPFDIKSVYLQNRVAEEMFVGGFSIDKPFYMIDSFENPELFNQEPTKITKTPTLVSYRADLGYTKFYEQLTAIENELGI